MKSHSSSKTNNGPNNPRNLNQISSKAKRLTPLLALLAMSGLTANSYSQTIYTWTGATSGDWADATNWDANGVPVDNNTGTGANDAGLTFPTDGSMIVFDGGTTPLPTSNIPDLGGNVAPRDTPAIVINQGGVIAFNLGGREGDVWSNSAGTRNIFTVGDGVGAAGEVTVNLSSNDAAPILARHASNTLNNFQVNADGILNFTSATIDFGWADGNRHGKITIDGGQVNFSGVVDNLTTFAARVIDFTSIGGTFTAQYGGDFADIDAVNLSNGIDFVSSPGLQLQTTDNTTSFTITAVPGLDPNYWTGTGGNIWDESPTVNFTTNAESDALVEDTFANAKAIQNRVTFADEYFDAGVSQAVVPTSTSISIATGGVATGFVDFTNNGLNYTLNAADGIGISGTTAVSLSGTGEATLNSPHTYTGSTIVSSDSTLNIGDGTLDGSIAGSPITNNGTLIFNNLGATSHDSSLSGAGTLEKLGPEILTLNDGSSLSGGTTVSSGTLQIVGDIGSGSHTIASGTVLELFSDVNLTYAGSTTISGDGILRKTGTGETRWSGAAATFELSADALIDIQEGILRGGSNDNEVWTDNLSDLNVATGATFWPSEANPRVDVITGGGRIVTGWTTNLQYLALTIGVADGSGTFNGDIADINRAVGRIGNLTKVGTGTQTLAGITTYTGNTTIEEGTLTLADGGELTLVPVASGINNVIAGIAPGSGTANLDGALFLDLSEADTTPGNSWLLVDESDLNVNYGSTFAVLTETANFTDNGGIWTLEEGGNSWTFTESTGILELTGTIYSSWAGSFGLTGGDTLQTADPDSDSASNLYEFGIGTNPSVADLAPLSWDGVSATATAGCPIINTTGSSITARFMRRKDHGSAGSISYSWEFSSELTDWESSDSAPAWLTAPTDLADDASGDYDLVEVPFPSTLDNGAAPRFFRLTVTSQ